MGEILSLAAFKLMLDMFQNDNNPFISDEKTT